MTTITTKCSNCSVIFEKSKSEFNRNERLNRKTYCSLSCSSNHNKIKKVRINNCKCIICSKDFYRTKSKLKLSKSGITFCSRKCKDLGQRLEGIKEIHPSHYGSGDNSYREIIIREGRLIKCEECGWNNIPKILEVHHKDRDRTNNISSNLKVLCPNCHQSEHYKNKDGRYKGNRGMGLLGVDI